MGKEMMSMAGFVPRNKMSKKAQKELNRQRRVTWEFSPVTKTVDSRKVYSRKKKAHDRYEDYGMGDFLCAGNGRPGCLVRAVRAGFPRLV